MLSRLLRRKGHRYTRDISLERCSQDNKEKKYSMRVHGFLAQLCMMELLLVCRFKYLTIGVDILRSTNALFFIFTPLHCIIVKLDIASDHVHNALRVLFSLVYSLFVELRRTSEWNCPLHRLDIKISAKGIVYPAFVHTVWLVLSHAFLALLYYPVIPAAQFINTIIFSCPA